MKIKKILIVDDEPFNLYALHNIFDIIDLKDRDTIIVEALDGQQALDIIINDYKTNFEKYSCFDLILMDFQMPIMDGNESTKKIR